MPLYKTPFSPAYWRTASGEVGKLRVLAFAALMVAAANLLGYCQIPVGYNLNLTTSFLARAVCAWVGGPVLGLVYAFVEDILGYMLRPAGPFFPGFTLNTMLAVFFYAVLFYRQKVTVWRIIVAKAISNYPINVGLGCLWNWCLSGKAFLPMAMTSFVKNTLYLPVQVFMILLVFQALLPGLKRAGLISPLQEDKIGWK